MIQLIPQQDIITDHTPRLITETVVIMGIVIILPNIITAALLIITPVVTIALLTIAVTTLLPIIAVTIAAILMRMVEPTDILMLDITAVAIMDQDGVLDLVLASKKPQEKRAAPFWSALFLGCP